MPVKLRPHRIPTTPIAFPRTWLLLPLVTLWLASCCICDPGDCGTVACVDFEDLTSGTTYNNGDSFADSGVTIDVNAFTWGNGNSTTGGHARVDDNNRAGGTGLDLNSNNCNLSFDFGGAILGLTLKFGEFGGNLNIRINGSFQNFGNFADIDGTTIGGVAVSVVNGLGDDMGTLTLTGTINSFEVGGQELWLDDLCH